MAVIGILTINTESSYLHRLTVYHNGNGTVFEACFDDIEAFEHPEHLLRGGIGTHIPIFGSTPQQAITHADTYHIGLVAEVFQTLYHSASVVRYQDGC